MGNAVKRFAGNLAKAAVKGLISYAGGAIPIVGGPLASYINSKFSKGSFDVGTPGVDIPEGSKTKVISTPAQLEALVKKYPEQASQAGLSVDMIKQEIKEAKEQSKAVGGMIKLKVKKEKSLSDKPKPKKARSAAQLAATKKLVEANKLRREKK